MINSEVFREFNTEQYIIEQNLYSLIQDFCNKNNITPNCNVVSFIKNFMKEETIVDINYAKKEALYTAEKNVVIEVDCTDN